MAARKKGRTMTPAQKSKKAHVAPPPRAIKPHLTDQHPEQRSVGEYTGQGKPPLEMK